MPTPSPRPVRPTLARARRATVLLLVAVAAACGGDKGEEASIDSSFARDLQLAQQEAAPPTFADTAMGGAPAPQATPAPSPVERPVPRPAPARVERETPRPAPVRERPAATPAPVEVVERPTPAPAPGPRTGRIAAGTGFSVTTSDQVCTTAGRPGDKIVATVSNDVIGADGARIPAGATAVLEVASVTRGDTPEGAQLVFRVRTLDAGGDSYSIVASADATKDLQRVRAPEQAGSDKKKVIAGAIGGAILGQIMGKDTKSTVIGAAAGAATGAVAAKVTAKYDGCLPAGATVRVVLEEPVSVAIKG